MFKKTRIRLTVLNAVVFFVIIVCLGVIVYTELRHQLYAKVDESLQQRAQQDTQFFYTKSQMLTPNPDDPADGTMKKTLIQVQGIDPRVFLVMWDDQGNSYPILTGAGMHKEVNAFKPYRSLSMPQTVNIANHSYRVYAVQYEQPKLMNLKVLTDISQAKGLDAITPSTIFTDATTKIVSIQAISLIDSEQNMLKQLFELILIGIVVGGAVTVLAGMYLANQALRPIKQSWDKQQQFVADASHELRMPLSIIRANVELAFRHPERSILHMSEPLSVVLEESKRMGRLTEQLLTLARADSNQEELMLKPLQLSEVIHEVVQKFEPLAELKEQNLELDVECGIELLGDAERIHQLLVILLDNSMKFTPADGTIRVVAWKKGNDIELVVEDTGAGISAEDLPYIFDRFYHGDKSRTRSTGGTGLGLAIAKWIVTTHGGEITPSSVLGQGTKMMLRFPVLQRRG
ncbi:Adaptive-response sensory-kinase SasA [Paenibacillus allorhizoplanae]|uniref:histidine kinase n=1 Tax=Paenibacillus allorhizoplanae TaxID=2905648 RepID=A0ABM9CG55_9BACL|nr:HAMP domain-containing sensor histidine kinase [Paenibacillus allorhizoplanae]CAH1210666.1 Adaptive-response sensory-kinase SasA [Paenibacillus allorhizoplanae]